MSRTVFILGAGASVHAGAPLMKDFLDEAEGLMVRKEGLSEDDLQEFKIVFDALAGLTHAQAKATLDLLNIESVFAAFEMAKLLGRLGSLQFVGIDQLPSAMNRVIVRTLERRVSFPLENGYLRGTPPYSQLVVNIKEASTRRPLSEFSFITFNYDMCLDVALYAGGVPYKYSLGSFKEEGLNVLKLHGSLNWGTCTGCDSLVDYSVPKYLTNRHWPGGEKGCAEISKAVKQFTHCQGGKFEGQYVVPPTWNKSQYHARLERVWKAAANELATAENIFVCGYSLPPSDQFFRYLYALGVVGDLRIKRFWVFDPDSSGEVKARFETLLGQAVMPRFKFFQCNFEEMSSHIMKHL